MKARGRNTTRLRTRHGARRARKRSTAAPATETVAALKRELTDALEQQTAIAEVLKIISSSPGELQPVFHAILKNATRICEAKFGVLFRCFDGKYHAESLYNMPSKAAEFLDRRGAFSPVPGGVLDQLMHDSSKAIQSDVESDRAGGRAIRMASGRSRVAVPMLKDGDLVGAFVIYRQEVRPFTEKQVSLLTSFAAQAVIAIENTRLFSELRQRTANLAESLEQQTATSEVLKVISRSPGELQPVFQAMLENATRICEASFGSLMVREGDAFRRVALHGAPPAYLKFAKGSPLLHRAQHPSLNAMIEAPAPRQIADMSASEPDSPIARFGHARALINVPMLKEGNLVGIIAIYRREARPFTNRQIE